MTIYEAAKSGKRFRRTSWHADSDPEYYDIHDVDRIYTRHEVLANDWVIEEPTITITRTQFLEIAEKTGNYPHAAFLGPLEIALFGDK